MAIGRTCSVANPSRVNTSISTGTIVKPPPMPNSPDMKPTTAPSTRKTGTSARFIVPRYRRTFKALSLCELLDDFPFGRRDRRDREPVAPPQRHHVRERRVLAQLGERHETRLLHELHVDVQPARRVPRRLGVVVGALAIELRHVRVCRSCDRNDAGDARLRAARVVEERAVAHLHLVAHEVARLIVANAEPRRRLFRRLDEVVDRELVRLGFHQPVAHASSSNIQKCGAFR